MQKEYPHLIAGTTAVARKMGFPDVIMPGKTIDNYFTCKSAEHFHYFLDFMHKISAKKNKIMISSDIILDYNLKLILIYR